MSQRQDARPMQILLVEDNPADARLTEEALRQAKCNYRMTRVEDGFHAMAYLLRSAGFEEAPRPHLILLDLNLPGKDGRQVLDEIKGNSELKSIPVIVMSSSEADSDIESCYQKHANCFIAKPVDFLGFVDAMAALYRFWGETALLPRDRTVGSGAR